MFVFHLWRSRTPWKLVKRALWNSHGPQPRSDRARVAACSFQLRAEALSLYPSLVPVKRLTVIFPELARVRPGLHGQQRSLGWHRYMPTGPPTFIKLQPPVPFDLIVHYLCLLSVHPTRPFSWEGRGKMNRLEDRVWSPCFPSQSCEPGAGSLSALGHLSHPSR